MPRVSIAESHHADAGQADLLAVTHLSNDRVITALRTDSGVLRVIAWTVAADGTITRKGDATAGTVSAIAMTDWTGADGVVTAVKNGDGKLELIAWAVSATGDVTRKGDATGEAVKGVSISSPDGFAGVVTPVINSAGNLDTVSWTLSTAGVFAKKSTVTAGTAQSVTAASLAKAGGKARVAVGVKNGSNDLEIITWSVTSNGDLARIGRADAGPISEAVLTARSGGNADLFSVTAGPAGDFTAIGWQVDDAGAVTRFTTGQGGTASSVAATTFHPDIHVYLVSALRTTSGNLKLIVWRNGLDLTRHGEVDSTAIKSVTLSPWSGGVVTVAQQADGTLRLTSWSMRPAGIRMLHQTWPLTSPAAAAKAASLTPAAAVVAKKHVSKFIPIGPPPPPPGPPGPPGPPPDGSGGNSPASSLKFFPAVSGVDPMLAVGHDFVVVTQDHAIAFLDKTGTPLTSPAGLPMNLSSTAFFQGFINPQNPDGTTNQNNINTISPTTISEFYDTRVTYDPATKRFVILSAARQPSTTTTRYFAFAISRTQDPRDGFEQYMTTESNYRDFPRLIIHQGMVIQGHNAPSPASEGETPVMYAFDLTSAAAGSADLPNWLYYPSDLNGAVRVFLVEHFGVTSGLTLLADIRGGDNTVYLSAFPASSNVWLTPKPIFATAPLASGAPWPGPFMSFRGTTLYMAGATRLVLSVPNVQPQQDSVRVVRVPFATFTPAAVTVDGAHIVDLTIGGVAATDNPNDLISYDAPGLAVNKNGDLLISYGRTGIKTASPLFPEVRYSAWKHGESSPRKSGLLQAGGYMPTQLNGTDTVPTTETHAYRLDYATAVIDPADDTTAWFISEYADGDTHGWKTVVGVVNPSS